MASDCIFCKIIGNEIPAERIYEDENCICIRDLHPQAKTHLLVIPKIHVASLEQAFPEEGGGRAELLGKLMKAVTTVARKQALLPGGFRTVINTNHDGGQSVYHLHLHVLGGEVLRGWFA
ncbi:histidine triad nucleotide-binding protein [Bdellovibrionota bacterium FG-2]